MNDTEFTENSHPGNEVAVLLVQIPAFTLSFKTKPNLLNNIKRIDRPLQETIDIAVFICTCKQIIQLPKVDMTGIIPTK